MDAALHLAPLTGLPVEVRGASAVSSETRAPRVHLPKPVTPLGHGPVTGTFEQDRGTGSIPENALPPEDPVRQTVTSRYTPVIA